MARSHPQGFQLGGADFPHQRVFNRHSVGIYNQIVGIALTGSGRAVIASDLDFKRFDEALLKSLISIPPDGQGAALVVYRVLKCDPVGQFSQPKVALA